MINDRYKIIRKLGTGRSQVYLCLDKYNPLKEIAIKILSSANNKELESFRNEYFLLKKINHPNIVQVFEYGTILSLDNEDTNDSEIIEGSKYFTQEYVEGENLQQYEPANNLTTLYQIVEQICTVLFFLHQSNYIYYDLKPENILIKNKKNGPHIYLYDFGLTKFIPKNDPFEVQGTPNYIAPEILKINRVDHRADLYSLGIMLYYLIYNKFPFATDNELNIYKANIDEEFEFPPRENYEDLIRVAKKLLCKSPSDRYQTSLHVLEELKLPISEQAKNNWIPIKVFCGRKKRIV